MMLSCHYVTTFWCFITIFWSYCLIGLWYYIITIIIIVLNYQISKFKNDSSVIMRHWSYVSCFLFDSVALYSWKCVCYETKHLHWHMTCSTLWRYILRSAFVLKRKIYTNTWLVRLCGTIFLEVRLLWNEGFTLTRDSPCRRAPSSSPAPRVYIPATRSVIAVYIRIKIWPLWP